MLDKKISANFKFSEFRYVMPDPRLLLILEYVRRNFNCTVTITDSKRTPLEHISIYRKLEKEKKIKTVGNKLGTKTLFDYIPWDSRHLPTFDSPYLRACDFKCLKKDGTYVSGEAIKDCILDYVDSFLFKKEVEAASKDKSGYFVGVGVGKFFVHLDIDRGQNKLWGYEY
jgi:hypothetical protein